MPEVVIFIVAAIAAVRGADWVGKASISIAQRLGVSSFVIGATLVSIATTLPELTVAAIANFVNNDPLYGLGNVLGSPIVNLGLILGLFFMITKHRPQLGYYSRSVNVLILISILLFLVSLVRPVNGFLSIFLIVSGLLFLFLEFVLSQKGHNILENVESRFERFISFFHLAGTRDVIFEFVFGTALLLFGAKFLVDSGIAISNTLGVDDFFISATLVALGTSAPELITMVTSVVKKRDGISIGNLVGASVLNLTIGVGLASLFSEAALPAPFNYLFYLTILSIGIVCLLVFFTRFRVEIIGGLLFALGVSYLILISVWEITLS
jgi:cation:H+ antiporter